MTLVNPKRFMKISIHLCMRAIGLTYAEKGRVWADYLAKVDKTITLFESANQICEDTVKCMWLFDSRIWESVKSRWGRKKLPNHQVFVSIFYRRNIVYLQSAHALASIGFINPSSSLCRTVFESIMRGYLFVVEPEEADEYFEAINTPYEETYNIKKRVSKLRKKLYSEEMSEAQGNFYKELCVSSHPHVRGTLKDYPQYHQTQIRDVLNSILLLMYGNIELMTECFINYLDAETKEAVKQTLKKIADCVSFTPLFEPDKENYSSKLLLKKGNFLSAL